MQKDTKNIVDASFLLLFIANILGFWLRVSPAWMADFPINDGGMFYQMILDLQASHYMPPLYTEYNNLDIPFAYPPLAFYIAAAISDMMQLSPLSVIRWLPGIVNALCIVPFYFLAREILNDKTKGALVALVFAVTPQMGLWLSMGGGITRSFGMLFMILAALHVYRLLSGRGTNVRRNIFWTMTFSGLTLLSHPDSSIFVVAICVYIWCATSRTLRGILQGALVAFGALIVAGPWYGYVIHLHGAGPFLSALHTGGQSLSSILRVLYIDLLTLEEFIDILGVFGLLGIIYLLGKREYFIPGMFILIYVVQPRSAHTVGNIPIAMAAAVAILDVLLPALARMTTPRRINRPAVVFIIVLAPYVLFNALYSSYMVSLNHLSGDEIGAMTWVSENTPIDSRFLVLTGEREPMCDAVGEWFPSLSGRNSLATIQGREWILSDQFGTFLSRSNSIKSCIFGDLECIERESDFFGGIVEYIFISLPRPVNNCFEPAAPDYVYPIVISLRTTNKYEIIFENSAAIVFRLK